MCLILLSGTFFLVFMRVCGLFPVSKKDWCPITVIPVFRDICKAKRSFHLIFQAGNSAFLRLPLFFPVVGTVKVFGRYIDRLTEAPNGSISSPQNTRRKPLSYIPALSPSTALITPSTMLSMRKNLPVPKTENRWKGRSIRLSIKTSQNRICSSQLSAVP